MGDHHKAIYYAYCEGEKIPHYVGKVDRRAKDVEDAVRQRVYSALVSISGPQPPSTRTRHGKT
jgi:hypothetical protein